jgi:sRNA-binding protein
MGHADQSGNAGNTTMEITNTDLVKLLRAQFPVFSEFRPLKIGIHVDLLALNLAPENKMRNALIKHTRDTRYLRKMVTGSPRYDLHDNVCGEVLPEQQNRAASGMKDKATIWAKPNTAAANEVAPTIIQELQMRANTMKVTAVITDFDKHLQANSVGAKTVPIAILINGKAVKAELNPKSFRKAQTMFSDLAGEAAVVISGDYDFTNNTIKSAGIVVQPKKPKVKTPADDRGVVKTI